MKVCVRDGVHGKAMGDGWVGRLSPSTTFLQLGGGQSGGEKSGGRQSGYKVGGVLAVRRGAVRLQGSWGLLLPRLLLHPARALPEV